MIEWSDRAIILSSVKYGESSAIITLFSYEHGLYKGLVRGMQGKQNRGIYEIGNIVETTWKARLSEQLGFFKSELQIASSACLLRDKVKLTSLVSLCTLLEITLPERDAHPATYEKVESFIQHLITDSVSNTWIISYISLEIDVLSYLGFRLQLHQCADTLTTEDLIYVSPKTGRAICRTSGEPYKDKLIELPSLLVDLERNQLSEIQDNFIFTSDEVRKSLALTGFFLNKCLTLHYRKSIPNVRHNLVRYFEEDELV